MAGRELGLYIGIATLAAIEMGSIPYRYNGKWRYKQGFASFAAAAISGLVLIFVGRIGLVISRFRGSMVAASIPALSRRSRPRWGVSSKRTRSLVTGPLARGTVSPYAFRT